MKIKGYIQNIQSSGSVKLLEIEDNTGKIIVVVFDNKLYVKKRNIAEVKELTIERKIASQCRNNKNYTNITPSINQYKNNITIL